MPDHREERIEHAPQTRIRDVAAPDPEQRHEENASSREVGEILTLADEDRLPAICLQGDLDVRRLRVHHIMQMNCLVTGANQTLGQARRKLRINQKAQAHAALRMRWSTALAA